jgi:hypothetical protein
MSERRRFYSARGQSQALSQSRGLRVEFTSVFASALASIAAARKQNRANQKSIPQAVGLL